MARTRMLADQLNKLVQDLATSTEQCKGCRVGPIVEIRPDQSGCNWKIAAIQGSHSSDCLIAMSEPLNQLRSRFALDCSNDMDPGLLTTWAMRRDEPT